MADCALRDQPLKSCYTCGRLISPNHRNFVERKNCSKTCSNTRLTKVDKLLEEIFVKLATKQGQVTCSDVEEVFGSEKRSVALASDPAPPAEEVNAQKAGMDKAHWRERVRRAGRRVIAFSDSNERFQCVQGNRVVEPSYAKGEWAVRLVKS